MSTSRRFMVIFDAHAGWDRRLERGKWVTYPTHHFPAWRATTRFAELFAPDIVAYGGDQINAGPISHWHKGRPILDEGLRLKDEMEFLEEHLLDPLEHAKTKVWMDGNHEQWIMDHVACNPGLQGMIEPESYLNLRVKGYDIYSQGEIYSIGKNNICHGDVVFQRGGGQNPAAKLVGEYRRNMRAGHVHGYWTATLKTAIDSKDYHTGIVVPGLCTRNPAYNKHASNNHIQGILAGEVWSDGSFNDYVLIINNGRILWNGKRIDGNKK